MKTSTPLRHACIVALLLVGSGRAAAVTVDGPQRYAVLSCIGDDLSIVTYGGATGSNVPMNRQESIPTPDHAFDETAKRAARFALQRLDATTPVALVADTADPCPAEAALVDDRTFSASAAIQEAVAKTGSTRIVLISKHRSSARVRSRNGSVGSGTLEGLGFYVDWTLRTETGNGSRGVGFLAPFAYVAVTLIDASTRQVIAQRFITSSAMISAGAGENNRDPWNVLSGEQKERALRRILEHELPVAIQALVGKG